VNHIGKRTEDVVVSDMCCSRLRQAHPQSLTNAMSYHSPLTTAQGLTAERRCHLVMLCVDGGRMAVRRSNSTDGHDNHAAQTDQTEEYADNNNEGDQPAGHIAIAVDTTFVIIVVVTVTITFLTIDEVDQARDECTEHHHTVCTV
jgi:hypothetical protein